MMLPWTKARCTEIQTCPLCENAPWTVRVTAVSRSDPGSMITAELLPNSSVTLLKPARHLMVRPTAGLPVNVNNAIPGFGGAYNVKEAFGELGVPLISEKPFFKDLSLDMAIRETSDGGHPIVVSDPDSQHAKVYRAIATRIWEKLGGAPQRAAPRIVVQ